MTATTQYMNGAMALTRQVRLARGSRLAMRGGMRLVGAALTISAVAIWLAPGANWEQDVMIFKLVLSLSAILAGVGLMQSGTERAAPEVEIDSVRREVRLQRKVSGAAPLVLERCSFSQLSRAEISGRQVRLYGADRRLMAEVVLRDRKAMASLLAGLEDAGKLV